MTMLLLRLTYNCFAYKSSATVQYANAAWTKKDRDNVLASFFKKAVHINGVTKTKEELGDRMKRIIKAGVFLFLVISLNEVGFAEETTKEKNIRQKSTVQKGQSKQLPQKELERQMEEKMIRQNAPYVEKNIERLKKRIKQIEEGHAKIFYKNGKMAIKTLEEEGEMVAWGNTFLSLERARGKAKSAVPHIGEILIKDPCPYIRKLAANALGMIGDKSAIPALKEALKDDDNEIIGTAIRSIGKIGGVGAISVLKAIDVEGDREKKINVGNELIRAGDKETGLKKLREEKSVGVLYFLILKKIISFKDCADLFMCVAECGEQYERLNAAYALAKFGSRANKKLAFKIAIENLNSKDIKTLDSAVGILRNVGDKRAMPYIKEFLKREDISYVKSSAQRVLEALEKER